MFLARKKRSKLAVVPYRNHDVYKWKVAGFYEAGKRRRRFFTSKREAETFVRQLEIKAENLGSRAVHIDPRLHVMAIECSDRLAPYGKTLTDAADFYCKHLEAVEQSCSLNQLVAGFLQMKELDGAKKRYIEELRNRLGHFQRVFGDRTVATISHRDCDDWLRALRQSPRSRNNYRRVLSVLFSYAVSRGYCTENPIVKISKAKVADAPVEVLTPEQTRQLLDSATPEILPYFALAAFGGLRSAELGRLDWSEIHLDRGFIEVSAAKSKTASRRLVTILPNLKAWLAPLAQQQGPVLPPNPRVKIEAARKNAGITKWPQNGLRHSFASYHLAHFQDAPALALQMGHTTTSMLFAHYREVVAPTDAEGFWKLFPCAITDLLKKRSISRPPTLSTD
jgi:integrase